MYHLKTLVQLQNKGGIMRNFALVQTIGTFLLLLYMIILWGLPLVPSLAVFDYLHCFSDGQSQLVTYLITAFSLVIAFIVYIHINLQSPIVTLIVLSMCLQFNSLLSIWLGV